MTAESPWTVLRVLTWTAERFARDGIDAPRLDAEVLLSHCLGVERVRLYMDHDKPLSQDELRRYRAVIQRRLAREPVAYITRTREFWSLPLRVDERVLVPRPETEAVVERALELLRSCPRESPVVVDVGTGSGAIALALARELPGARVLATDIASESLEVARDNAGRLGLGVTFHEGDLLAALPADIASVDLVVANLPYIRSAELDGLQPEVARWEPRGALDGGADGLSVYRRLVPGAAQRLAPGGAVAVEMGPEQADALCALLAANGLVDIAVTRDLAGCDRVVSARDGRRGPG